MDFTWIFKMPKNPGKLHCKNDSPNGKNDDVATNHDEIQPARKEELQEQQLL